jgi:hypothetical protein
VSEQHAEREQRVTSFELFFDLVFVFGFTQVTTVLSDDPTWSGLAHGLLILGALWWAWAAYAWLTNAVNPDEGAVWGRCWLRWRRCSSPGWPSPKRSAGTVSSSGSPSS